MFANVIIWVLLIILVLVILVQRTAGGTPSSDGVKSSDTKTQKTKS